MKYIIALVILFCISLNTNAQVDTCFTEEEIVDISFTIDSLYHVDSIHNQIIQVQKLIINELKHGIKLDSLQRSYDLEQIKLLKNNIDIYIEREKILQPKWYDNNMLWFTGGVITTIITTKFIADTFR
jgi:hypothetical protein